MTKATTPAVAELPTITMFWEPEIKTLILKLMIITINWSLLYLMHSGICFQCYTSKKRVSYKSSAKSRSIGVPIFRCFDITIIIHVNTDYGGSDTLVMT